MIELDVGDLDDILDAVENIEKNAAEKIPGVIRQMVRRTEEEAWVGFYTALYSGVNDVEVSVSYDNDGYNIDARGEAVTFIEFGTGLYAGSHPQQNEFGFIHGQFGQKKGSNPGGWYYTGSPGNNGTQVRGRWSGSVHTRGDPAQRIMYNAGENLEYRLEEADYEI